MSERRLKVARIISRLNIGGPSHQAIHLTRALAERGFDTILVVGREAPQEGNLFALAAEHGVHPVVVDELGRELDPKRDLSTLARLIRLFRQHRPDIVHTHLAKAGAVARLAAWLTGVPVIVHTYHGHVFRGYFSPARTRVFLGVERALARITNALIAISPLQQREIAEYLAVPMQKLHLVPNGFDLEPFGEPEKAGGFRCSLGLSDGEMLVGIVGRLTAIKDHQLFLQAAALVAARHSGVQFVVVGDGELREQLEGTALALGIKNRVHFTGWRTDMPEIFADLTLSVLTSRNEGTPTAIIESLASRCPVVATAVGGVPDLITDGAEGFLVAERSADLLADRILALLADQGLRQRMGEAGRRKMRQNHRLPALVDNITNLYAGLWENKSAGRSWRAQP